MVSLAVRRRAAAVAVMQRLVLLVSVLCMIVGWTVPSADATTTVIDVLSRSANFSSFISILQRSHLIPYINSLPNCTLFAPTNDAIKSSVYMQELLSPTDSHRRQKRLHLERLVRYHLIPDDHWSRDRLLQRSSNAATALSRIATNNDPTATVVRVLESAYQNGTWLGGSGTAVKVELMLDEASASPWSLRAGLAADTSMAMRIDGTVNVTRADLTATKGVVHEMDGVIEPPKDIETILAELLGVGEANQMIRRVDMDLRFSGPGPWTVFVPIDQQVSAMNWLERSYLSHERGRQDLSSIVRYHVHQGHIYASELADGYVNTDVPTLQNEPVTVARDTNGQVSVNHAALLGTDIIASNGVIHTVNATLQPTTYSMNTFKGLIGLNATEFADAFQAAKLGQTINATDGTLTVLAVSDGNSSLTSILDMLMSSGENGDRERLLRYHLLPGELVQPQRGQYQLARSILADKESGNVKQPVRVNTDEHGQVTHINEVEVAIGPVTIGSHSIYMLRAPLLPPQNVDSFLRDSKYGNVLLEALQSIGELPKVQKQQELTLFVPSPDAFDRLGLVYDALRLEDAQDRLRMVIRGSVAVAKVVYSDTIGQRQTLRTLGGGTVTLERANDTRGTLRIYGSSSVGAGNATITMPDLAIRNGVAHVIDNVIVPAEVHFSLRDLFRAAGGNTFLAAIDRCGLGGFLDKLNTNHTRGYTFFVPTDEAFSRFNDTLLFSDLWRMRRVIFGHIVSGWVTRANSTGGVSSVFKTLLDSRRIRMELRGQDGRMMVGMQGSSSGGDQLGGGRWATVERTGRLPIGVVHRIDDVLFDGTEPGWSWLLILLTVTGVGAVLGGGGFYGFRAWSKRRRTAAGYEPL